MKKRGSKQPPLQPRHWLTLAEYYRMGQLGFFGDDRVQLIRGRIVTMPPMSEDHATSIGLADEILRAAFGPGWWIRVQLPLHAGATSAPEPDVAVVRGGPRDYKKHPTTAPLAVEVSDSSLRFDRKIKGPLYAAAKIEEYWIINLVERQLEVHRDPQPVAGKKKQAIYAITRILKENDTVTPLAAPQATIKVADLLP